MRYYPRGSVLVETPDGVSGFLEDLLSAGKQASAGVVESVKTSVGTSTSDFVQNLIKSSEFSLVLKEVEAAAQKAVVEEASRNALNLFILAIAGGAIGGMVFKGKTGGIAAGVLAVYAASQIFQNSQNTSQGTPPVVKQVKR